MQAAVKAECSEAKQGFYSEATAVLGKAENAVVLKILYK